MCQGSNMPLKQFWHSQDFLRVVDSEMVSPDSSELPVHKVLAHVRSQLNGSDRGAFHKAVYPRVSAEKQGMYVTMD